MAKKSNRYSNSPELIALGCTIRQIRTQTGMSQEALALSAELDHSYVGGIERGEHNVALMNILRISEVLGVSAAELLTMASL